MEESERPNKIRKINHARHEDATDSTPNQDSATPMENVQQTETAPSHALNGGTEEKKSATAEAEADSASKATLNPAGASTSTTTQDATTTTDNGTTSSTQATASAATEKPTKYQPKPVYTLTDPVTGEPLTKNQQKKLRRQQEWDQRKEERRLGRKDKAKAKKERDRAALQARIESGDYVPEEAWKEKKKNQITPTQLPVSLIIDCDFDDKMKDNERISLSGQITRSYSDNKNAPFRCHLAVSSFQGKLRERFDGVLAKHYLSWKGTHFVDEDFMHAAEQAKTWMAEPKTGGKLQSVFSKYAETPETEAKAKEEGEVIYLSSDSDYTLTELKPYSTYIIGGLVDKNREKGICHRRAVEKGVKTARLPIGDYLDMASRKVLATNHVVEIMVAWLELGDWGEAFMKVIPKRKGGTLKGQKGEDDEEEGEYDDDVEVETEAGANDEDIAAGEGEVDMQDVEEASKQDEASTAATSV